MERKRKHLPFFTWMKDVFEWLFDFTDWKLLLRSIPGLVTAIFVTSVVVMNLMASKVIISTPVLGITGGLLISWVPFLAMDMVVKTYGSRAANKLNILGLLVNLVCIGIFQLVSVIEVGSQEGQYSSFNATFSQTWQIFVASSIAFVVSGIANNLINSAIGNFFKKDPEGRVAYITRTYISTAIGQFIDNFIFAGLAFLVFFRLSIGTTLGYTMVSVLGTAVLGALLELGMEIVFSPIGYSVCQKWRRESVGADYLAYCHKMEVKEDVGRINY